MENIKELKKATITSFEKYWFSLYATYPLIFFIEFSCQNLIKKNKKKQESQGMTKLFVILLETLFINNLKVLKTYETKTIKQLIVLTTLYAFFASSRTSPKE